MSKQTTTDFDKQLFNILMDYGDFFLTDYPKQAEKKSIHPTIARVKSAVSELVEECIPRVDKPIHITLIEKIGLKRPDEWTEKDNIEKGRIIERVEIRQRFKGRGITIK